MKYFIRWLSSTIGFTVGGLLGGLVTGNYQGLGQFIFGCSLGVGTCLYLIYLEDKVK
jgi:hypothetical protein